jgi:hypothetical protein
MHVKCRLMGSDENHSDLTDRRARMWGVRGGDGWVGERGGGRGVPCKPTPESLRYEFVAYVVNQGQAVWYLSRAPKPFKVFLARAVDRFK